MQHYSLWLEKYAKNREALLGSLKGYKQEIDSVSGVFADKGLILPLEKTVDEDVNASMCFVDGGEGLRELLGAAIYFIRASGLIIDHKGPERKEFFVRDLDMNVLEYDDYTKDRVDYMRSMMEFDVAERCIEQHSPEYVFIDGSLYVNFSKRPVDCEEYVLCRKKFSRLLRLCKQKGVHILGVSEDSRSRLFVNYLSGKYKMKFPKFMTDSSMLRLLSKNTKYRTIAFTPQSRFESDGNNGSSLTASFPTFYIQPTEVSNPLRIDVPDWEKNIDGIIKIIIHLSRGSKQYGYPMPLYLAHLDARIEQKHADWSTTQLIHYLSKKDPDLYDTILRERRHSHRP